MTDEEKAVIDTKVSVAGGQGDLTDKKGKFSIRLSRDFIQGERVILRVEKPNWVINHPLDGEWNLPSLRDQNVHETKVVIVPKGSKKLWTHNGLKNTLPSCPMNWPRPARKATSRNRLISPGI